jgi:hypothetical protein
MPIASFLNPETERVDDSDEDLFQQIADAHADADREAESGDEAPPVTPVSLSEALEGLATLRLYEEQQQDGNPQPPRSRAPGQASQSGGSKADR